MRPAGSAKELEARRRFALRLLEAGWLIKEVALKLGVSRQAVSGWKSAAELGGKEKIAAKPPYRRTCRLTEPQRRQVVEWLHGEPFAVGLPGRVWTTARVVELIRDRFGVTYHPAHLGRLLHQLGFSWTKQSQLAEEPGLKGGWCYSSKCEGPDVSGTCAGSWIAEYRQDTEH